MPLASAVVVHSRTSARRCRRSPPVCHRWWCHSRIEDQEINATRIAQVGAGIHLDGRQDATEGLADAVSRVLTDGGMRGVAAAAHGRRDRLSAKGSEIVATIEGLATSR